jgi:hypothetical protein
LLLLGLLFHLSLEYAFNLPMFQWDVLTAYVLFIDPDDLARTWQNVRCLVAPSGWPDWMIPRVFGNRGGG